MVNTTWVMWSRFQAPSVCGGKLTWPIIHLQTEYIPYIKPKRSGHKKSRRSNILKYYSANWIIWQPVVKFTNGFPTYKGPHGWFQKLSYLSDRQRCGFDISVPLPFTYAKHSPHSSCMYSVVHLKDSWVELTWFPPSSWLCFGWWEIEKM